MQLHCFFLKEDINGLAIYVGPEVRIFEIILILAIQKTVNTRNFFSFLYTDFDFEVHRDGRLLTEGVFTLRIERNVPEYWAWREYIKHRR